MKYARSTVFILIMTFVMSVIVRVTGYSVIKSVSHADVISFLSATGHQGEYQNVWKNGAFPNGNWTKAADWKRFIKIEKPFCFKTIGTDLANFDVHPPLYFWMLHIWSLVFGINLWTGAVLNILIDLIAAFFLFRLAMYVLGNSDEAALVTFFWALSPAVFPTSFDTRSYCLLALITILFVTQVIKYSDQLKVFGLKEFITLSILTAAGALTYYFFAIVVTVGCLYVITKTVMVNKRRLLLVIGSTTTGYFIFYLLHMQFYKPFLKAGSLSEPFAIPEFLPRVQNIIATLQEVIYFPLGGTVLNFFIVPVFLMGIIIWLSLDYFRKNARFNFLANVNSTGRQMLFFLILIVGIHFSIYLSFLVTTYAMQAPKYLTMAWPFFAFVPVFILRLFGRYRSVMKILFCLLIVASSIGFLRVFLENYDEAYPDPEPYLADASAVVCDDVSRGLFPRIFWKLSDDTPIFAGNQNYLIENSDQWLSKIDTNSIYVSSDYTDDNTKERQKTVLALIGQFYEFSLIEGAAFNWQKFHIEIITINRNKLSSSAF